MDKELQMQSDNIGVYYVWCVEWHLISIILPKIHVASNRSHTKHRYYQIDYCGKEIIRKLQNLLIVWLLAMGNMEDTTCTSHTHVQ